MSPARLAKRGVPRPKRDSGSDRIVESQKLDTASLGVTQDGGINLGVEVEECGKVGR